MTKKKSYRKKLGAIVFADAEELQFLNQMIHPEVKREFFGTDPIRTYEGHNTFGF